MPTQDIANTDVLLQVATTQTVKDLYKQTVTGTSCNRSLACMVNQSILMHFQLLH